MTPPADYLFRGDLASLDPDVAELIRHETARQERYLIMIASESTVPYAVREALMSSFHNLYAEGYPLDETRQMSESELIDYNARLPEYRRIADKRYYKGTEYANIVESLARRRAAELFATPRYPADKLFINVQPLSGAPANSAIFSGLINVGDTVMGLDLLQGGHLTHGSPVARSGKQYKAVSYSVDPVTERLDYDAIRALAVEHRPKIIIGGYTSYPFAPDWAALKRIADEVGAYLMADIAHVAGLVIAGVYPSPVGIADVVSFTTHKTLAGPRGAIIITHRADVANKVDRGVFPGEQGGPHVNTIAALAVALRLAHSESFHTLQQRTVANAARLALKFEEHGFRVPYGGTDTHMVLLDCKSVVGADGTTLSGDMAARILDLAGIVCNRNTIPGDMAALRASGLRFGTPWITQRGFGEAEIDELASIITDLLKACIPFSYTGRKREEPRAKVDFDTLEIAKRRVRDLTARIGIDTDSGGDDYPHVAYLSDDARGGTLLIRGIGTVTAARYLDAVLMNDVSAMQPDDVQRTAIYERDGSLMARGAIKRLADGAYQLYLESNVSRAAQWLRGLSDGFILFDPTDPYAKVPGAVDIQTINAPALAIPETQVYPVKYFIAAHAIHESADGLPAFQWAENDAPPLMRTPLHALHKELGAKMAPFAGYDMPLWYGGVAAEHHAVRGRHGTAAGVFDVTHMGVFDAHGEGAAAFLDAVTTNDVYALAVGESHYTYLLDPHGAPLDDLMIYRLADDHYLIVVNASNNDKNWAWLNAVKQHQVMIDPAHPSWSVPSGDRFTLRDLRAASAGADQRVDVALQGAQSKAILLSLGGSDADKAAVGGLAWAGVTRATLGGFDLIVSRTGYTGERVAYELFVHPDQAAALFSALIAAGATPCGLAARDSLRIEAGLPLYGHELAGDLALNPADAGFGAYVKLYKPYFIGKAAFIAHERERDAQITRFKLVNKGARPPHAGDPLVDGRGRVVGIVTSCSIDSDGYQLGQAYVKLSALEPNTPVSVFCGAERLKTNGFSGLNLGDKVTVPEPAAILTRFPTAKKA
jgi:glycine hydroxymethyltransferase